MPHGLAILLGHHRPEDDSSGEESGKGLPGPLVAAAEEVMQAIHGADAKALAEALCDFYDLYESEPHDEYDHEGKGEEE